MECLLPSSQIETLWHIKQQKLTCERHWTKQYPMVLIFFCPLSPFHPATFPDVLDSSGDPADPNPILEFEESHCFSSLPRIPILDLQGDPSFALKPSKLQLGCKEACEPISVFHMSQPSEVLRYFPSAINEYRELTCLSMTMTLVWPPILIPSQILEKGVTWSLVCLSQSFILDCWSPTLRFRGGNGNESFVNDENKLND